MYQDAASSAPLLSSTYSASLRAANDRGLRSVAFPAISCGVYGYPLDEAAAVAVDACRRDAGALAAVEFWLFGEDALAAWQRAAEAVLGQGTEVESETAAAAKGVE